MYNVASCFLIFIAGQKIVCNCYFVTSYKNYVTLTALSKSLVTTDHFGVFVFPKVVEFWNLRECWKIQMQDQVWNIDWTSVFNRPRLESTTDFFSSTLQPIFDSCFPVRKVKISLNDPPYSSLWEVVNVMTGRMKDTSFSSNFDLEEINWYFQLINMDPNYIAPTLVIIPEGTRIPHVEDFSVLKTLNKP